MKRKTKVGIITGSAGALMLGYALISWCDRIIFQPPRGNYPELAGVRILSTASGSRIALRHTPAPPGGVTVLHSHGNAENLASLQWRQEMFSAHGYGFVAYDYEGYGQSSGSPSEAGAYRAVERAWNYLTRDCAIPPEKIIIHGFSVGTGPSVWLASRVSARGLILEAPFTSTFAVAGLGWVPGNRFPSIRRIADVKMPLWVIHGDRDRIIPQYHGKRLFKQARNPKEFWNVDGAGHNNLLSAAGAEYWSRLKRFTDETCEAATH